MMSDDKIVIERVFDAPREAVWKAWTDPELIKQWWGPEGFTSPSVEMDFKVGGKFTYAMKGPEGSQWDRVMYTSGVYKEIVENEKIVTTDYFSDKDGNLINPDKEGQDKNFPKELTATFLFEDAEDGKTKLSIIYPKPENEEEFQAILKSGMEEGWQSSLNKVAAVLEKI